jgi:hypothetical protein
MSCSKLSSGTGADHPWRQRRLRALSPRQIKDNLAAMIEKGKASGAKSR